VREHEAARRRRVGVECVQRGQRLPQLGDAAVKPDAGCRICCSFLRVKIYMCE
jgi:hypothetical protein